MASQNMNSLIIFFTLIMFLSSTTLAYYEFFVMDFQWGPAYCRIPGTNCQAPLIVSDKFTIHGMWPSNHSDPQPNTCINVANAKGGSLDPTRQLPKKLRDNLLNSWPSYSRTPEWFWRHEWRKHGTCSFNKFNQKEYFLRAFNNWNSMNLYDFFKREKIVPGNSQTGPKSYDKMDFIKAIKKHHFADEVTVIPKFYCNRGNDLREIKMCMDYDGFKYMNCTGTSNGLVETCGNQKIQWYA